VQNGGRLTAYVSYVYISGTYVSFADTRYFTTGLTVADFKDTDAVESIEFKHKSGIDVSSKQCQE